jgi:hypothetical protein
MSYQTVVAWTMRNSLGEIPRGMRGPKYREHHLTLIKNYVILGIAVSDEDTLHEVLHFERDADARDYIISLTSHYERNGLKLVNGPTHYEALWGDEFICRELDALVGPPGYEAWLESIHTWALEAGDAA